MTAKRFILDEYLEIGSVIIDTENENVRFKHENKLSMKQCCDLLNEQHEQIQELIQSSKELEEDCQSTFNAMSRKQDDLYRKNFKLKEENEQLKQQLKSIEDGFKFSCTENHTEFDKDKLYVKDTHTKIHLDGRNLFIEVYIPQIDEFYRFKYTITGKSLMREFIENYNPISDLE